MRKNILEACLLFVVVVVVVVVMVVIVLLLLIISSQKIFDESLHWIVWQYVIIMLNFQLCGCFPPTGCYLVMYQKKI